MNVALDVSSPNLDNGHIRHKTEVKTDSADAEATSLRIYGHKLSHSGTETISVSLIRHSWRTAASS